MTKLHETSLVQTKVFLPIESLQLFQQHSEVLGSWHIEVETASVNDRFLPWTRAVLSAALDHRFLTMILVILQNAPAAKKTQIFRRTFLLKNQLSRNVFLQISHLRTQAHCSTALTLDTTEEDQNQMVRWLSAMVCWFCRSLPVAVWAALVHERWSSRCKSAVLTPCPFPFPCLKEIEPSSSGVAGCCCFFFWLYLHRSSKTIVLISELKLILHLFAASY